MFTGFQYGWSADISCEDFIRAVCKMPNGDRNAHFSSQAVQLTIGGEWCVDFLGRFERMSQDWRRLRAIYPVLGELPHAHRSTHEPYQSYYTPGLAKLVREAYSDDIEKFGYSFA